MTKKSAPHNSSIIKTVVVSKKLNDTSIKTTGIEHRKIKRITQISHKVAKNIMGT